MCIINYEMGIVPFTITFFVVFVLMCVSKISTQCERDLFYGPLFSAYEWNAINGDGVYYSSPLCLDVNYNPVRKHCFNGVWYPKHVGYCYNFVCPRPFVHETEDKCLYVTEPRTYEAGCPSLNYIGSNSKTKTSCVWDEEADGSPAVDECYCSIYHSNLTREVNCTSLYSHKCTYDAIDFLHNFTLPTNLVNATLTFSVSSHKLLLTVYSPESLEKFYNEDAIRCFSNDWDREMVRVNRVYNSRNSPLYKQYSLRNFTVYDLDISKSPSEYWCHVFEVGKLRPITTEKVVAYKQKNGNEYSLRVTGSGENVTAICAHCRIMQFYRNEIVLHLTSNETENVIDEFRRLKAEFENSIGDVHLWTFRSSEYCLPDVTITGSRILHWKLTPLGSTSRPSEVCFDQDGNAITRQCGGSFLLGAEWAELERVCFNVEEARLDLSDFVLHGGFRRGQKTVSSVDLTLVSENLYHTALESNSVNAVDFFNQVSTIMTVNRETLRSSQVDFNSTDRILDAVDYFLINESKQIGTIFTSNLVVYSMQPLTNNILGIASYKTDSKSSCNFRHISKPNSYENLTTDGLEFAVFLPDVTQENNDNLQVIVTVFNNDNLFPDRDGKVWAGSKIISLIIPGVEAYLHTPIIILFKQMGVFNETACGFWDYGQSKQGRWSNLGGDYIETLDNNITVCSFSHLTHFALVVVSGEDTIWKNFEEATVPANSLKFHDLYLTIITLICCSLSFIGVTGIFLTAFIFKRWGERVETQVICQLSVVIVLEIFIVQSARLNLWSDNYIICTCVGALLHYIILSKFAYMFVITFFQYLRFVKVAGAFPREYLLKSIIFGSFMPLIPLVISLSVSPSNYDIGDLKFCSAKGDALYFGQILPVTIIAVGNIILLCCILFNVGNRKLKRHKDENAQSSSHLAALLFSLICLPWILSVLVELLPLFGLKLVLIYLFYVTLTLQGFVVFFLYIVVDRNIRLLWFYLFNHRKGKNGTDS